MGGASCGRCSIYPTIYGIYMYLTIYGIYLTIYGIYLIRFHKVQRRRRQTPQSAAGGQEGEEERAERLRATERMTLRHGRQGKWAREVLARKKRDPAARTALSEHSLRSRALTQHAEVESEGDSEG